MTFVVEPGTALGELKTAATFMLVPGAALGMHGSGFVPILASTLTPSGRGKSGTVFMPASKMP